MMQKKLFTKALTFLCSQASSFNPPNPSFKTPSLSLATFRFYTSKPDPSSQTPISQNQIQDELDDEDVTTAELKTQIDKFNKGDFEAIPTIFESILKRKLAGKHEESDDELMNEIRQGQPNEVIDEDYDLSSSSDSDSDSDE